MQRIRIIIVVALAVLVAACSPATAPIASPGPETSAAADAAPSQSAAASAEASPSPSAAATLAPTETAAPPDQASVAPTPRNGLTLWYGYGEGSAEEQTLLALADRARQSPDAVEVTLRRVPGDELINRFEIEAAAGGGPDLLLTTSSNLGRDARAGLLRSLDDATADVDSASLDTMRVDGRVYGLPLSSSTVALYSNSAAVPSPPATTQALLNEIKGGRSAVLIRSAYYNFGFFAAFGGRLLDENGRCIADQGGFAEALAYLRELKAAGAQFVASGQEAQELFRSGQADLTIDGDWLWADYRASVGDQLVVAPLPAGPAGPARPLVTSSGIFINANTQQPEAAVALALALTAPDSQQAFADQALLIPTNPQVVPADAALAAFTTSAQNGLPRPQQPELDAFWQPFDAALGEVLETDADPVQAVQSACAAMNSANGK